MPHQLATIDKIKTGVNQNEFFIRYDLSGYYDKIPHDKLIEILSDKIDDDYFIQLIRHSINNHIDKKHTSEKRNFRTRGIPQGLSISNILANIYGGEIDDVMSKYSYSRYVDDILLLFENEPEMAEAKDDFEKCITLLGLEENKQKRSTGKVSDGFDYLGYSYDEGIWKIKRKH